MSLPYQYDVSRLSRLEADWWRDRDRIKNEAYIDGMQHAKDVASDDRNFDTVWRLNDEIAELLRLLET